MNRPMRSTGPRHDEQSAFLRDWQRKSDLTYGSPRRRKGGDLWCAIAPWLADAAGVLALVAMLVVALFATGC